jgi:sulfide:quinone oxidoreductase
MSRVTIIGAGFGALNAIRELRKRDRDVGIDVVAPRPVFLYYPAAIWIPTTRRRPEELEIDLRRFFERQRVTYHEASATGLSDDGRTLATSSGEIANDALIIGCGGSFLKRAPGLEHTFLPCGGVEEIARMRDRLHALDGGTLAFGFAGNPDEPSAMRGGPVFEFLFGVETWLRRNRGRDRFRLVFFSPAEKPGQRLGGKAVDRIVGQMDKRGIEMRLGEKPVRFEADRVVTSAGEFESDLTMFMPGMTGNDWFDATPLARSPGGLLRADEHCRADGAERVYVVGDAGSYAGPDWLPKQGHTADLQGRAAARNVADELAGRPPSNRFRPELVCIVDTLDKGLLITRNPKTNRVLPPLRAFHWIKRAFEWNYTRAFR